MKYLPVLIGILALICLGCTQIIEDVERATDHNGGNDLFGRYEEIKDFNEEIKISDQGKLVTENVNGNIIITASADAETIMVNAEMKVKAGSVDTAKMYLEMIKIEIESDEGYTSVKTRIPDEWKRSKNKPKSWTVNYDITVPESIKIESLTTNGNASVMGVKGDVDSRTTNGNATVDNCFGNITARTTNGNTKVSSDSSEVLDIDQRTTNGSNILTLPNATGGEFELRSTNGNATINMPNALQPKIQASTTNGNVRMDLPDNLSAQVDLTTTNGSVKVAMAVEGKVKRTVVNGKIGEGVGLLDISTKNGNIVVE